MQFDKNTNQWPPQYQEKTLDKPLAVPYLQERPAAIDIKIGRQLFVDDYLIDSHDLERVYPEPELCEQVIFEPKTPLEMNDGYNPCATPFNDGLFYDDQDQKFKMWYHAGWFNGVGYAESQDGINWTRLKELYPERESESVIPIGPGQIRDGAAVWLDYHASEKDERYKLLVFFREFDFEINHYHKKPKHSHDIPGSIPPTERAVLFKSANGIDWTEVTDVGPCGDNTGFFYNPFTKKWVFSLRTFSSLDSRIRTRGYYETEHFFKGANWTAENISFWSRTDIYDMPDEQMGYYTQLYDLTAVPYESIMLGVFNVFMGPPNNVSGIRKQPKICDLKLGYSRDGFHFSRGDYANFISSSREEGTWNYGYAHAVNGGCIVVEDELYFYFSCFSGQSPKFGSHKYAGGNLGLAKLRRDGFAYLTDQGKTGQLLTQPLTFAGSHLFVNVDSSTGQLLAEVVNERGEVISGFSKSDCLPVTADSTKQELAWKEHTLAELSDQSVRIRFYLDHAQLYAFWVSDSSLGHSGGYLGGGGPSAYQGRDKPAQ
ncbi:hypothetical protein SAMN04488134_103170 [Amphibacillus marinus]|uniref:Glycosyl hydrolase family 32 n=1 Tax=Amphibacillus marinus TaxID=872970 RepID=A0A1H8LDG4_9BACI|nr:hypothetical protein [Amphibacillus marinus]SEO03212.1 hypothetical protein SAMN04488134_103170 [Amphibacillus marinus]